MDLKTDKMIGEKRSGVGHLIFNNPEKRNATSLEMWQAAKVALDNFAEDPEHKCGHTFKMDDGNYFIYPNNRIVWTDDAYIYNRLTRNPGYKIDQNVYTVENKRTGETTDDYMTEFGSKGTSFKDTSRVETKYEKDNSNGLYGED